ncbi:MAG: proprotein convertase P-domain-containing protein [Kofleriaceae bacterium]
MSLPMFAACAGPSSDSGPTPYDDEFPVSDDNVNAGAPDNDSLPDDNKADATYPAKFVVGDQSPVKSQGGRGVCSIFASTALAENLYIKAGMPIQDADFSEQYLQWAVKNLEGSFRYTEGSSSDANLRTIVQFGTIKEAEWPYESAKWGTFEDAECTGGENLPTKCYTNGEPPASVEQALKIKLPRTRWINTNSMKAHLTSRGTGVNIGFTFFYQSWNHRLSTLPINDSLWRMGVVTYPNQADKDASLQQRAGHAIQIVGWDDEAEFEMRDGDGNPILDQNGVPRMEKGFWIFKNSWGTESFGIENPYGAGYGYLSYKYASDYGSAVTADLPVLAVAEVCDDPSGIDEDGDFAANCADSDCAAFPACGGSGTTHEYSVNPSLEIPDNSPVGAVSTIEVPDSGNIVGDVKVSVDISHSYRGDLTITLTKDGVSQLLFDRTGGGEDNLVETFSVPGFSGSVTGSWQLKVEDTSGSDVGTLNSWTLQVVTN